MEVMTQALNYSHGIRAFPFVRFTACMPIFSDSLMILTCLSSSPPHTHSTNYAIFWRGTWHIRFASASLSYLAVISPLSFLLNVCINSCYVCFFAPMPCATLMESAIHCMRTQLAMHTHTPTNTVVLFFSWVFDNFLVVPSLVCVFNVCSYWMISKQKCCFYTNSCAMKSCLTLG